MHIQVRTSVKLAALVNGPGQPAEGSITLEPGSLSALLAVLAEDHGPDDRPFSLAAASGYNIELGGEFSFWVHPRPGIDDDHEIATQRAMERVGHTYDPYAVDVENLHLPDEVGALKAFVDSVTAKGLHIVEISIGAPEPEGIPVQIYTARTS